MSAISFSTARFILQCLAELGHIQQAEGVGPLHDLIQVIPHAPHLLDQHRYIGGRGLLHLRAVQDAAAVTSRDRPDLRAFLVRASSSVLVKRTFISSVLFKTIILLNAGS